MKVRVIQPITTSRGTTPVGTIIDIPDTMLDRLKGKVEPLPFDSAHWQRIIKEMVADFGDRDARGGCWQWVQENCLDLWREHLKASREADHAYSEQDARKIEKAVSRAKDTHSAMLQAWEKRNQFIQPSLVSAKRK